MSTATPVRLALNLEEAAAAVGVSPTTIRRAIHATDPAEYPPPLRAKRDSRGKYFIGLPDLQAWFDSLPDA